MDDLSPPFIVAFDRAHALPLIRTERGQHLVASIAHDGDAGLKLARLFAAAPDLKAALASFVFAHGTESIHRPTPEEIERAMDGGRAALAKAEG